MRLWIRNPLAVFAENAEGGIVVEGTRIAELVPRGATPAHDEVFDASRHVLLPGLVNAHHHFYQTLARAHPVGMTLDLVPWLVALYPIWGRFDERDLRLAIRVALAELLFRAAPPPPTTTTCSRPASNTPSTSRWRRRGLLGCAPPSRAAR